MSKDHEAERSSDLGGTWRLLAPHALPRLPLFIAIMALGSVASFGEAAVVLLLEPTFNLVLFPAAVGAEGGEPGAVQKLFEGMREAVGMGGLEPGSDDARLMILYAVAAALGFMGLLAAAANYAFSWLSSRVALQMVVDLRLRLTRHLMALSLHFHGNRKLGDLLSRISADVSQTLVAVNVWFRDLTQNTLLALFYLATALYASPELTLGVLVSMPLLALPIRLLSRKVRKGSTRSLTTLGASVQVLSQMLQGIRTVRAFGAEEKELERYRRLNETYIKDSMKMVRAQSLAQGWTTLFSHVGMALLLVGVGYGTIRFGLFSNPGKMTIFFMAIAQVYNHIKRLTRAWTTMEASVGASKRLSALLEEMPDLHDHDGALRLEELGSGIRIEGLGFRYPQTEQPVLEGLDLVVRPGETLALVGSSGSGKSTLMNLVCRFFDPTEGRITVDGHDLREVSVESWRRLFSIVDQSPFLFHTTVGENIRYGRENATQEQVEDAARAAHIHDFIASLPLGYETDVADMGTRLSGGQRQRITIARALLEGAPLLLLDEATSNLDTESEVAVQGAIENLMRGRTAIVIAHRLSTIRGADRIAVLDAGRLVELGTHDELIERGGPYARAVAMQQLGAERTEPVAGGSA